MASEDTTEWVRTGLQNNPTEQNKDIQNWLYGKASRQLTAAEQTAFVQDALKNSPNDWQLKVFSLIMEIPSGHLISYGELASWTNQKFGLTLGSRNTAWLRKRIYKVIGHDTMIPIHRVTNSGDTTSASDHCVTQEFNKNKRAKEGSFNNPIWLRGNASVKG